MMRPKAVLRVSLALVVVMALNGCGGAGSSDPSSTPQGALKAYDLAWAEGNAKGACELLGDAGRVAVEKEMSNRTLGGLPLNCPARMNELLELLGPESKAQLEELADKTGSDKIEEEGRGAEIKIGRQDYMILGEVNGKWFIGGNTIKLIDPMLPSQREYEEYGAEEEGAEVELDEAEEELGEVEPAESPGEHAREQEGEDKLKQESATVRKEAEEAADEGIEEQSGEGVTFTECPEEPYVPGLTFTCDAATKSGRHYHAEFEVLTDGSRSVPIRIYLSHEH